MKKLLTTNPNNTSVLIARLILAFVVFPHGAQKLFGWFGGYGFNGTMGFLTGQVGLPYVLGVLVILIEAIASLFILFGFATRIAAFGIFGLFLIIMTKIHMANGFFMNWGGNQKGEGVEYFVLLLGLAIMLVIGGGGKASLDSVLVRNQNKN